jgi:integrase
VRCGIRRFNLFGTAPVPLTLGGITLCLKTILREVFRVKSDDEIGVACSEERQNGSSFGSWGISTVKRTVELTLSSKIQLLVIAKIDFFGEVFQVFALYIVEGVFGRTVPNVAQKTKLPRRQHGTERVVLTPVQVRDIAATLNEPARSVTLLLVLTGLRVGELLALRWGSIDLKARLLRVVETVYDGHFDQPKTKRSTRTIPIGTDTAEILAAIRPAAVDSKTLVFATREG